MIITNELRLPEPIVNMARTREYCCEPNEYRVTQLLKGTRETILERRHAAEITCDVSDMIWLLFGSAVHSVIDQHEETATQIKEERIKVRFGDYTLSGQFDLYDDSIGRVTDYKTASVWKIIYGNYQDWRKQVLMYCLMLRKIGFNARSGEIVAILKDHSKRDAKFKPDYPKYPVRVITFTDFSEKDFNECEQWIQSKFVEIQAAEKLPDDELPICTPEERFNSGDKFAVMKKGRKTAMRVLDSREEAEKWKADNGGDFIEVRPGENKKCADYCSVSEFCNYFKNKQKPEGSEQSA